jgi:plastocyanin/mono/diheme cytochrome c family protein
MHLRFFLRPLTLVSGLFLVMALLVSLNLGERTARRQAHTIDIAMSTAEQGGFTPASLRIQVGQTVRLRFHSSDVAHAVAIGPGLDIDLGVIAPGETKEVTLTIERPGVYTFYCNLWCSPEHWRMRGVIDVFAADGSLPPANSDPVIAALTAAGIDIDGAHGVQQTTHSADHANVLITPDAATLAALDVPDTLRAPAWKRTHALADAIAALDAANPSRTDAELASAAAALWLEQLQDADLAGAAALYAKNCAACHGATGRGDGMAASLAPAPPAPFTATALLERRSDVLYAKIRRGGMGTGMPNFGTLFTPEETWALVDYLWLLALGETSP